MNTRDIVQKAWQMTQVHLKKLIWLGAVPAFFTMVVSSVYMAYQYYAFSTSNIFTAEHDPVDIKGSLSIAWDVISSHPTITILFVIFAVIFLIGRALIPPIFEGALIHAIYKINRFESIEGSMEVGVRHFFPIFEFGILTGSFAITTIMTEASFILRWWGDQHFFHGTTSSYFCGCRRNYHYLSTDLFAILYHSGRSPFD